MFYTGSACKVWCMPHYVFTGITGNEDDPPLLAVAMDITEQRAMEIAHEIRMARHAQCLPHAVDYTEVPAYAPWSSEVGDIITGQVAMTLPKGSSIVCVGTAHVTTDPGRWALLRGVVGYIQPNLTEGPVQYDARFRILYLGKVRP